MEKADHWDFQRNWKKYLVENREAQGGMEKCARCRGYSHECKYDMARGVPVACVLCNRCVAVLKKEYPTFWAEQVEPHRRCLRDDLPAAEKPGNVPLA